ncbi:MAG TPA: glycine betaine ABC transporter substrate-binding protein [Rubrobacteraceae bacterium]|nr:glycine betaine ABC transporter substrate-binding protein [Rubrobacteraceae bacterium]
MKANRKFLAVLLALVTGALVLGCGGGGSSSGGGGGSSEGGELNLGVATGWDEAAVVANLSKLALEEDLGYQVQLQELELGPVIQGVASGDLDAYQDIWLPNHQAQIDEVENDIVQLEPWYDGETEFGIAVPTYMQDVNSIADLNNTGITQILGIEPGAIISERIPESVIPTYGLKQEYVTSSTPSMLSQVEELSGNQEEFAFVAWKPHWMNATYDFKYLEDPEDGLTDLNDGATISSIVNEDLPNDDPVAYAFLGCVSLTEEQVNEIEAINPDDYAESAATWLEDNRDVVEPWVACGQQAQES